jgi:hypothetical protein
MSRRSAAEKFREAIIPNIVSNNTTAEAERYADALINQYFHHPAVPDMDKLHGMAWLASLFVAACDIVLEQLDGPKKRGRRKGDAWQWWVTRLEAILGSHDLPTSVRKDVDKNKTGKPSPFVAFVRELQGSLPERYRRSTLSDVALAKAINDALHARPRDRKLGTGRI